MLWLLIFLASLFPLPINSQFNAAGLGQQLADSAQARSLLVASTTSKLVTSSVEVTQLTSFIATAEINNALTSTSFASTGQASVNNVVNSNFVAATAAGVSGASATASSMATTSIAATASTGFSTIYATATKATTTAAAAGAGPATGGATGAAKAATKASSLSNIGLTRALSQASAMTTSQVSIATSTTTAAAVSTAAFVLFTTTKAASTTKATTKMTTAIASASTMGSTSGGKYRPPNAVSPFLLCTEGSSGFALPDPLGIWIRYGEGNYFVTFGNFSQSQLRQSGLVDLAEFPQDTSLSLAYPNYITQKVALGWSGVMCSNFTGPMFPFQTDTTSQVESLVRCSPPNANQPFVFYTWIEDSGHGLFVMGFRTDDAVIIPLVFYSGNPNSQALRAAAANTQIFWITNMCGRHKQGFNFVKTLNTSNDYVSVTSRCRRNQLAGQGVDFIYTYDGGIWILTAIGPQLSSNSISDETVILAQVADNPSNRIEIIYQMEVLRFQFMLGICAPGGGAVKYCGRGTCTINSHVVHPQSFPFAACETDAFPVTSAGLQVLYQTFIPPTAYITLEYLNQTDSEVTGKILVAELTQASSLSTVTMAAPGFYVADIYSTWMRLICSNITRTKIIPAFTTFPSGFAVKCESGSSSMEASIRQVNEDNMLDIYVDKDGITTLVSRMPSATTPTSRYYSDKNYLQWIENICTRDYAEFTFNGTADLYKSPYLTFNLNNGGSSQSVTLWYEFADNRIFLWGEGFAFTSSGSSGPRIRIGELPILKEPSQTIYEATDILMSWKYYLSFQNGGVIKICDNCSF